MSVYILFTYILLSYYTNNTMCVYLQFVAPVAVDSNYVAFGEKAVLMVVDLYGMTASELCVVKGEILRRIIEVIIAIIVYKSKDNHFKLISFILILHYKLLIVF